MQEALKPVLSLLFLLVLLTVFTLLDNVLVSCAYELMSAAQ